MKNHTAKTDAPEQSPEITLIRDELTAALGRLTREDVERAVRQILSHERIFVGGAGRTGLMLKAFAMRLMQAGRTVFAAGETVTPAVREGDLLFLASASGKTRTVVNYARTALEAGAELFTVTASENSALAVLHPADVVLPCGGEEGSGQIMGSLFEQTLLIYCDAVALALPAGREEMRSRHANLE